MRRLLRYVAALLAGFTVVEQYTFQVAERNVGARESRGNVRQETRAVVIGQVILGIVRTQHHVADGRNIDAHCRTIVIGLQMRSWFRFLWCLLSLRKWFRCGLLFLCYRWRCAARYAQKHPDAETRLMDVIEIPSNHLNGFLVRQFSPDAGGFAAC